MRNLKVLCNKQLLAIPLFSVCKDMTILNYLINVTLSNENKEEVFDDLLF